MIRQRVSDGDVIELEAKRVLQPTQRNSPSQTKLNCDPVS